MPTFTTEEIKAMTDAADTLWHAVDKHDRRCGCALCNAWFIMASAVKGKSAVVVPDEEPRRRVGRPLGK